jgi:arginase
MTVFEERVKALPAGTVALLGIPLDENSSFLRGAAQAPKKILEALHSGSANMSTELGLDLGSMSAWVELGDMPLSIGDNALAEIEGTVSHLLDSGARVLSLGGDHSVTYPIVKSYAKVHKGLNVLQLDAHPDTYEVFEGNRFSHACPFARIMEEGLGVRLVQLGIRTMNPHQREQAERLGVTAVEMKDLSLDKLPKLDRPLYVSLDLDVLDPAFAPGVSHHEPGGLTTRDVLHIIQGLPQPLVGADIVELNPTRDINGVTAMVAAKLCKELVGRMLFEATRTPQKR